MVHAHRNNPIPTASRRHTAFSLVELVMVVTIIGIVAAIAVPRMASASATASANALRATLTNIRKAIDVYFAEHGSFPGYLPGTTTPDGTRFVQQLLEYTDETGASNATYGYPYVFGPYLRSPFSKNLTNNLKDVHVKAAPTDPDPADGSVGWVAVLSTGDFQISATDGDLDKWNIKKLELK